MSARRTFAVDDLAARVGGRVEGDGSVRISGLAPLGEAGPSDLSLFADRRYRRALRTTRAGALVTREPLDGIAIPRILHPDPFLAVIDLVDLFFPRPSVATGVHPLALVSPTARIEENVTVSPFATLGDRVSVGSGTVVHSGAVLGDDVQIGNDCVIWNHVVIREGSRLGDRVVLHPGAVLGADGFGFARRDGKFLKIRHVGTVVVEDDVEIGANATIDRGTLGRTLIRRGVKIDNLVHIAHNVEVGEDSAMAAQVGVSGSTVIGRRVLVGGQTGFVDHLVVGDDAILVAQSGVIGDVPPGAMWSGYPARDHRAVLKETAELAGLSRLRAKIRELEREVQELKRRKEPRKK